MVQSFFRSTWRKAFIYTIILALLFFVYVAMTFDGDFSRWPLLATMIDKAGQYIIGADDDPSPVSPVAADVRSGTSFDTYRLSRMQAQSKTIELLQRALEEERLTEKAREEVIERLMHMVARYDQQKEIESWLMARGLGDAVVYANEDAVEVIVEDRLTLDDIHQIGDMIARTLTVSPENITIVDGISLQ